MTTLKSVLVVGGPHDGGWVRADIDRDEHLHLPVFSQTPVVSSEEMMPDVVQIRVERYVRTPFKGDTDTIHWIYRHEKLTVNDLIRRLMYQYHATQLEGTS